MIYERFDPSPQLSQYIESYWLIDSGLDATPSIQKIIPDGYSEIIFHYGDPYKMNLSGEWILQEKMLIAGQIRNHFFLQNTGRSGMFGVKFKPTAISSLFGLDMTLVKDKVVPLDEYLPKLANELASLTPSLEGVKEFINTVETTLCKFIPIKDEHSSIKEIADQLIQKKGLLSIKALTYICGKSERQLERLFAKHIGLSPKFYSRIIRLGHIFELMQSKDNTWSDLVYKSGFYDQPHFIKNFKEFTGEDPSSYGFEEKNMANFHMNK